VNIGKALSLPAVTVYAVLTRADNIKISIRNFSSLSATKLSRTRNGVMEKIQEILAK
jgi:ABC-type uncharacterized transport system ATPase subunit